jgi:hypothetical protein
MVVGFHPAWRVVLDLGREGWGYRSGDRRFKSTLEVGWAGRVFVHNANQTQIF